ncbi:C25 family cysteine peptidase, partial [Fibrobacterota bacterium]
ILLFSAEFVNHNYSFKEPKIVDGKVSLEGCRTSRQGFAPMVAVKPVALVLPINHTAVSFEVEYNDLTPLAGEHYLKPFRPSVEIGKKAYPGFHTQKSDVYKRNENFPAAVRSNWFRIQYKCGIPIFITLLKPVQYNPVTCKIQYFKNVSIKINTIAVRAPAVYNCTPAAKSSVQGLVDNPEALTDFPITKKDENDYDYLIVTMNSLKDAWGDLVEFNKRRCLKTQIQTIDYIKSNASGRDDAEKLRTFIKQEYNNSKITYVMLGGDADPNVSSDLPERGMRAYFYDCIISPERYFDEKDVPAEMYFSCLDGDWKTDSGGTEKPYFGDPGTEDMFWDVYTSRFPVDNTTDLNNMMDKTIKYSENPVADQVTNLFLAGNFLWDDWGAAVWGGDHMDEFLNTCTKNSYTTQGFPTDNWDVSKLYEKSGNWSVSTFRSRVGSHKPAFIEHLGHGNTTYAFEETNSGVTTGNYTNDGTNANFFIITTGACYPGNFDNNSDCLMEKFLRISTGAVASQAFTRTGMEDDNGTDGVGQRVRRFFHDAIFNSAKKIHHLEMALGNGKESNAEIVLNPDIETPPYYGAVRFTTYGLNNMGDPALSIWTDTPKELQADYPSPLTTTTFTWDTKNPYTWVALCAENGDILTTQFTGMDGKCSITDDILKNYVQSNPTGKLLVRVKAHNYLPFEGELPIQATAIQNDIQSILPFINTLYSNAKTTTITYTIPVRGMVNITIFNSKGKSVNTVSNEYREAGKHQLLFDNQNLGNGCYYCIVKGKNIKQIKKFIIAR